MATVATATNGTVQAGYAQETNPPVDNHALAWAGTADSCVDLQALLPSDFVGSMATGVDAAGDVFGVAHDTSGHYHAIEWVPVPEPLSAAWLVAVGFTLGRQRKGLNKLLGARNARSHIRFV